MNWFALATVVLMLGASVAESIRGQWVMGGVYLSFATANMLLAIQGAK